MNNLLDQQLPDARLNSLDRKRKEIVGPLGKFMERVYCVNCGTDGGAVTKEWAEHIFYLCNVCAETHGALSIPAIPDEIVRGAVFAPER